MGRFRFTARLLVGSLLVFSLVAIAAPDASASHTAKISLHALKCPRNTHDVFGVCHSHRVPGLRYTVTGVTRATNLHGTVSWGPGAGVKTIRMNSHDFALFVGAYVYCRDLANNHILFNGPVSSGRVTITTTAGHHTFCDWYNLT